MAEFLQDVEPLRNEEAQENAGLSELQSEFVQLAADLHGDDELSRFVGEASTNMTVREASEYVSNSFYSFLRSGKQALSMGVDEDVVVDVWSSLATGNRAP